jgi:tetratricopeptide (TPR) repeat protein
MGTPAYMPPEQAGGEIEKLDERADVFGLGAILCVILTGQPPYVADTIEATRLMAVRGQLAGAFARLDACGADPELISLAKKCLAPERADRPRDATVVKAAVARYLAGVEERARRAEVERAAAHARTAEERKRRRVQLALAACVILLIGLGGLGVWGRERAETDRARVEGERRVEQARAEAAAERARAGIGAAIALSADLRKKYRFGEAQAALDQAAGLIPADGPVDLRDTLGEARNDLAFVRELDDIRMKRSIWIAVPGGINEFDVAGAPRAYRAAFSSRGMEVVDGDPTAIAARIRASAVKPELLAGLDDWAAFEPTPAVRDRVLAVARQADPGPWQDRFRNATKWPDKATVALLAKEADPAALSPGTVTALAELMWRHDLDPTRVLLAAEAAHSGDFLIPFSLGTYAKTAESNSATIIGHMRVARSIRPDNIAVLNYLVLECGRAGDVDGARDWYREAVRVDPGFSRVHVNMGKALCDVGRDFDGAIACFREAIRLDPGDAKAHYNLGLALRNKGNLDAAIGSYREAVRLNPDDADGWHSLGIALGRKGDADPAIEAFETAIRLNPKRPSFHTNLGNIFLGKKDLERAIAHHREAVRLDPKNALGHYNLGLSLRVKGDRNGAVAEYREAVRLNPTLVIAQFNLGVMLQEKGDADGAIAAFESVVRSDPKNVDAHTHLGAIRCDVKRDYDGAAANFRTVIRLEPTDPHAHYNLGNALRGKGDLDGAIASYREAVRLDSQYFQAHSNLGLVLQFKGDLDAAVASYQTALRINPKDAIAQLRMNEAARLKAERNVKRELGPPPREVK